MAERTRLANAEQLNRYSAEALAALIGADDDSLAAADLMGIAERALNKLSQLDETKESLLGDLQGLSFQLTELVAAIQGYQNTIEFNPRRLDEVEERLELISSLKRKYGDTVSAVLATKQRAEAGIAAHR